MREYFREMNVSEQLADEMLKISPSNVRYLDGDQQEQLGLSVLDPVERETMALEEAQKLGMSRTEYNRREALVLRACSTRSVKQFNECRSRIMATGEVSDLNKLPDLSSYGIPAR